MSRLKLSSVLLGATALSLPLGMTAFAQQTQQTQQNQQVPQTQPTQQGQQAAAEQGTELGACEKLYRLIDEAADEKILAEFAEAPQVADQNEAETCALVIREVEQAGGISEEAIAEERGIHFITETETFSESERITQTVEIEQTAIVEGEVLVRQPIPEIAVEQPGPQIGVTPGQVGVAIREQPAEITIRQAPATVRIQIPEPVITIEQPAPEIVLHMPPPGVSLDQQPPRITVEMPDPSVTVAQGDPMVTANVEARFVSDDEMAEIEARGDEPLVKTVTERLNAAGEPLREEKMAEVTVRKGEPEVVVQTTEQKPDVRFQAAEPRIVFEQAEPNVEVAFAESARVEVRQVGEPTVRIVRDEQQQASANDQQQATQGQQDQQALQQGQQDQQAMQQNRQDQGAIGTEVVTGQSGGLQIGQRVQVAMQALEQQDPEAARAELDAANQELAMAMEQADETRRQQLQGIGDQLALVIVALDQQDPEGARTALADVETAIAEPDAGVAAADVEPRANEDVALAEPEVAPEATTEPRSREDASVLLGIDESVDLGEPEPMDFRVGDLGGTDVVTMNGEEVGDIEEIATSAGVTYAIIESGGFLGMGEEHIAIPLDRIAMRGDDAVLLGLTEEEFERITEYDFAGDAELSASEMVRIGRFE